ETIRASALLRARGVKFVMYCIGDGPIRPEAENLVRTLGLEDQVVFTGYITEKEVSSYLLTGDLFIFPTTHAEGFPNILFRAVSLGLPVVTTKIRAAAEYLREPENCLFSTDDPANIADKISELIEDGSLRARMSASNVEFGRQLTPDVVAA